MGDHTSKIGPRVFRGGQHAANRLISSPISLNSYNDLFEATLPNSNQMSCADVDGDLAETLGDGRNAARAGYGFWVDAHGDSTAKFGKRGDIQSCAE